MVRRVVAIGRLSRSHTNAFFPKNPNGLPRPRESKSAHRAMSPRSVTLRPDRRVATRIYRAGESWSEQPGAIHSISRNVSKTEPAKLLAVFVLDTNDKALTTPIK